MTHDTGSFKKVAVLTGLTMLVGGAEISQANAATASQDIGFNFTNSGTGSVTDLLSFSGFNTALGTLKGVSFGLISNITNTLGFVSAAVDVNSATELLLGSTSSVGAFNFGPVSGLNSVDGATTTFYSSAFGVNLVLTNCTSCEFSSSTWDPPSPDGLTVTYTYTPAISATPLPAALPLFATGLAGLGFTAWRRRRKQKAIEQA